LIHLNAARVRVSSCLNTITRKDRMRSIPHWSLSGAIMGLALVAGLTGVPVGSNAAEETTPIQNLVQRLKNCESSLAQQREFLEQGKQVEQAAKSAKEALDRWMNDEEARRQNQLKAVQRGQDAWKKYKEAEDAVTEARASIATLQSRCAQGELDACREMLNLSSNVLPSRVQRAKDLERDLDLADDALKKARDAEAGPVPDSNAILDYARIAALGYGPKAYRELDDTEKRCDELRDSLAKATHEQQTKEVPVTEQPAKGPGDAVEPKKLAEPEPEPGYQEDVAEARRQYREARALDLEGKPGEAADSYRVAMSLLREARDKADSPERNAQVEKAIERLAQRIAGLPDADRAEEDKKNVSRAAQREAGQRQCESEFPNSVMIKPDPSGTRYYCGCKSGFGWNAGRTACVRMSKQALGRATCESTFRNSVLASIQGDKVQCRCPSGRMWNASRTACVRGTPSQTAQGLDPRTAYAIGALIGQVLRSKSRLPANCHHRPGTSQLHCGGG
jgi:hypothetical protein